MTFQGAVGVPSRRISAGPRLRASSWRRGGRSPRPSTCSAISPICVARIPLPRCRCRSWRRTVAGWGCSMPRSMAAFRSSAVVDWAASKSRIDPAPEFMTSGYAIPKLYATLQLGKLFRPSAGRHQVDPRRGEHLQYRLSGCRDLRQSLKCRLSRTPTNPLVEVGRNFTAKLQHTF